MLTAQEERELFLDYKLNGNMAARNQIVHNCLRHVIKIAYQYATNHEQAQELVAAGNVGVLNALDRYDPNRNTRFLSYAHYWIKLQIRQELYNMGLVKTPVWHTKARMKLKQVQSNIRAETGKEPTPSELSKHVDLTSNQIQFIQKSSFCYLSFDTTASLQESVGEAASVDRRLLSKEARRILISMLKILGPREKFVLRAYYGLVTDPMHLKQISRVLGVSTERVRQIKATALETLQRKFRLHLDIHSVWDLYA